MIKKGSELFVCLIIVLIFLISQVIGMVIIDVQDNLYLRTIYIVLIVVLIFIFVPKDT